MEVSQADKPAGIMRYQIREIEIQLPPTNYPISLKVLVDGQEIRRTQKISPGLPLEWKNMPFCTVQQTSHIEIRVYEHHTFKLQRIGSIHHTVAEIDESSAISRECSPPGIWVKILYSGPTAIEGIASKALSDAAATKRQKRVMEKLGRTRDVISSVLLVGSAISELDPRARAIFKVFNTAWEKLAMQEKCDASVEALINGLSDMLPSIQAVKRIAERPQLRHVIEGLWMLIDEASQFVIEYKTTEGAASTLRVFAGISAQEQVDNFLTRLRELKETFDRCVSIQTLRAIDESVRRTLLDRLNPVGKARFDSARACLPGTREKIVQDIIDWATCLSSSGNPGETKLMWVHGQAGLGKSSIATSVCKRLDGIRYLAASFFCKRDDSERRDPQKVLTTIIFGLAVCCPSYAAVLGSVLEEDPMLAGSPMQVQFEKLVRAILGSPNLVTCDVQHVIVVDAVDECADEGRRQLLDYIVQISILVPWLKIIITSRPNADIKDFLGRASQPLYETRDVYKFSAGEDIRLYIEQNFIQSPKSALLPKTAIDQLVERADGLFIWARTACEFILYDDDPQAALQSILVPTRTGHSSYALDDLYTMAIKTSADRIQRVEQAVEAVQSCLGAIISCSTRTPLSVGAMTKLFGGTTTSKYRHSHQHIDAPVVEMPAPTRESTPVGSTRLAAQQLAKTDSSSPSALLKGLYDKSLVPQGEEASVDNLANALLLLSKQKEHAKNTNLLITLRSIAALLKVASNPLEKIQSTLESAVESLVTPAILRIEESVTKISSELGVFRAEYSQSSSELVERMGETRGPAQVMPGAVSPAVVDDGPSGNDGRRSYAAAVTSSPSQRMERPAPVVTTRIEKQDRQILLDSEATEGMEALSQLPESALVLKAKLAMEALSEAMKESMPEGAHFRSANVLQNGGVVYEMNSKEAADWIKRPDICAAFADQFGSSVRYRERSFPVVVECVPVSFDTASKHSISKLEHDNNLPANSIVSCRYIVPPAKRRENQRHAFIVVQFRDKEAANVCIRSPIVVEGKQCDARKLAKKPVRCTKCQKFGHPTKQCKSPTFVCGTCPGQHDTKDCRDRVNVYCRTCGVQGHPTWDTKCPGYYAECASFATRVPDNLYKYFVTSEEWTWEKVTDAKQSITSPPPFQPTAAAFSRPPPPRFPRPPPFGRAPRGPTIPATNANSVPLPTYRSSLQPIAMTPSSSAPTTWGAQPTSSLSWGDEPAPAMPSTPVAPTNPDPGRYTPSAPPPNHPRPENVASPAPGGSVIQPRATPRRTGARGSSRTASPARSQSIISTYLTPRRGSVSSTVSEPPANVNGSHTAQDEILRLADPTEWDIILLQEPYFTHLKLAPVSSRWHTIYPTNHHDSDFRSCSLTLISKRLSTNEWRVIPFDSRDVTCVELTTSDGQIRLFNIYNDLKSDETLELIHEHLLAIPRHTSTLLAGDFNRHHPMWDETRNEHLFTEDALELAQNLIELLDRFDLNMILPAEIPTLELSSNKNLSRPDNVFASSRLANAVVRCLVVEAPRISCTDHFTIQLELTLTCKQAPKIERHNFKKADWDKIRSDLATLLPNTRQTPISDVAEFDARLDQVMAAMNSVIKTHVPLIRESPYAKRWWTPRLKELHTVKSDLHIAARRHKATPSHPLHSLYARADKEFREAMRNAKRDCWRTFIDEADGDDIWTAHKYLTSAPTDGGAARIPTLKTKGPAGERIDHTSNEQKSAALHESFFPTAQNPYIEPAEYPEAVEPFQNITKEQLNRVITNLKPHKTPGPDAIPNVMFKECRKTLVHWLLPIFRATFSLKHYPQRWKESNTVVLRKPGKKDYTIPKAYRPIALLNVISKLLSACVADSLNDIVERHGLLPEHHFGGRRGRSTSDAMQVISSFIKDAWRGHEVVAGLFLDVKGAFPSASPTRLAHNMRMKGIPEEIVAWTERKLQGRRTLIKFDDYTSEWFNIEHGIDQGCPLSCIYYLLYNSGAVELANSHNQELASGFVDDIALLARAKSLEEANAKLVSMMDRPGGMREWATSHTCEHEYEKTALIGFSRRSNETRLSISIAGTVIRPTGSHKFLGVIFDEQLRWKEQAAKAVATGTAWVGQMRRVARINHGFSTHAMRRLHQCVLIPRISYAADVWFTPITRSRKKSAAELGSGEKNPRDCGSVSFARKLATVQRRSAIAITGALGTTSTMALDAHANILPIDLAMNLACYRATIRMATLPVSNPLRRYLTKAGRYIKRHRSALHELLHTFNILPSTFAPVPDSPATPKILRVLNPAIPPSKEAALDAVKRVNAEVRIYSDGSGIDGGIGAAAVLCRDGQPNKILRLHLGSDKRHVVYEAELVGAMLALHLLANEHDVDSAWIGIDNQAVLHTLRSPVINAAPHLVLAIADLTKRLTRTHPGLAITTTWVPAHVGVPGNELADVAAKEAAKGLSSDARDLPAYLRNEIAASPAAAKQAFKEAQRELWKQRWEGELSGGCARIRAIDESTPSNVFHKLAQTMPRRHASLLIQLRSGHIPLNAYLYRFGHAESASCPACNQRAETVEHYLMNCPAYEQERQRRNIAFPPSANSLPTLLSSKEAARHLITYVRETGRFHLHSHA
ncbi:Reverse transcriptase from transposon X-element protein [Ceratobasidium sp. AG-Ba]|nr:Reverse transcriptase from transposon X-element protein [Ceratobasidium sp. AG-Ba]